MLLKQSLNNPPISLDGPRNCIFTHASIKVNVFMQKNIISIATWINLWKTLFRYKYFFPSCVFFKNVENDHSLKDYS